MMNSFSSLVMPADSINAPQYLHHAVIRTVASDAHTCEYYAVSYSAHFTISRR
jgi:hypothetical protein